MLFFAFLPLFLLALPPTASQRGPLGYGRLYGRYGHRHSYGSYGHGHRIPKTSRTKYLTLEPWVNRYKKVEGFDPVAEPEPEPRYKSYIIKSSRGFPVLKKLAKITFLKTTTPQPPTVSTITSTTTKNATMITTESLDDVFEISGNAVDKNNIHNQRLTIEVEEPSSISVTPSSVGSFTKGWSLIPNGFSAVPAVPVKYVLPDFMPVPAVPEKNEDI